MGGRTDRSHLALPALLLGATAIGLAPIFVRLSELGPVATAFHRMFLALPALGVWWWLERGRARMNTAAGQSRWLIAAGLFFAADLAVWHWSIRITTVANATLLANFAPVFVALAGVWLFGERVGRRLVAGLVIALGGAVVLTSQNLAFHPQRVIGDGLGLLTAVFYAGYIISVARLRSVTSTATIMFLSSAVCAAALLPVALLSGENLVAGDWRGWSVLFGLALVSHVAGQGLIAWALAHLGAPFGSVSLLWQPVAAALLAWLLFGEALGSVQIAGGALVLVGILIARRRHARA